MAACDPSPDYATPEPPLVGLIQTEVGVTATGQVQEIQLFSMGEQDAYHLRLTLPAGAYPAGTRVTFRLLANLDLRADTDLVLGSFTHQGRYTFQALQILPASLDPTVPLRLDLAHGLDGIILPWSFEVLHARESEPAWTVVGEVSPAVDDPSRMSFAIDRSGLWALGQLPLPPSMQGHFQRVALTCDGVAAAAPSVRAIDVVRNAYRRTTTTADGCEEVRSGTLSVSNDYREGCVDLVRDGLFWQGTFCYVIDASGTAMTWNWLANDDTYAQRECASYLKVQEQFVLVGPSVSVDAGAPSMGDASCSSSQDSAPSSRAIRDGGVNGG